MLMRAEGDCMFDVYLNEKRDRLLVVAKGQPIPNIGNLGRWRKKKGAVAVSDEIKLALQRDGFYWRRRAEHRGSNFRRAADHSDTALLRLEAAAS
jgi:hypothetical protein